MSVAGRCLGRWLSGSGGHIRWSLDCSAPPVWIDAECSDRWCDAHLPRLPDGTVHPTFRSHVVSVSELEPKDGEP